MDTVAIPQTLHLRPIQLTAVPVKLNVTVAPDTSELPAVPPLKAATSEPRRTQAPAGLATMAALSSSKRVAVDPPFATVTVITADSPMLPAVSCARACNVWEPSGTVRVGPPASDGVSSPRAATRCATRGNWTPRTGPASEAVDVTGVVLEGVAWEGGWLIATVGGVVSGRLNVTLLS